MIAFHFPPYGASSGIQRTLRFVQHLPDLDWQPIVLTAHRCAYENVNDDLLSEIPAGTIVEHAFALDAARHLSIFGRYPAILARPDRWMTWQLGAVLAGLRLIRRWQPAVIWSTYPIATAHAIGGALHRRTRLPWVADFRDPMAQDGYPEDPLVWRSFQRIEERAIRGARLSVFTTPTAVATYRQRYPDCADRFSLLENGFDEETFASLTITRGALSPGTITLLHSGVVYPTERDPTALFAALQKLAAARKVSPRRLKLRFRAAIHEGLLKSLSQKYFVEDYIEILPPLPYRAALEEMVRADALLVLQAKNCNQQIPAKIYEYLRARRPILALTDPAGDTASVLRAAGIRSIVSLESAEQIAAMLPSFIEAVGNRQESLPEENYVRASSRRSRAKGLAELFERASKVGSDS